MEYEEDRPVVHIHWTAFEREWPNVVIWLDDDGTLDCPECGGLGWVIRRNYATLSPSDDYAADCGCCKGVGSVYIVDDR